MIRHFTSSAIVFNNNGDVLLVHHNKLDQWLYPGGHIDPNEDPAEAALREVLEETGIHADILSPTPFQHPTVRSIPTPFAIIEMDIEDRTVGPHRHIDFVYVCRARNHRLTAQVEEVRAARWIPVNDVATLRTPAELPALITAAARLAPQPAEGVPADHELRGSPGAAPTPNPMP